MQLRGSLVGCLDRIDIIGRRIVPFFLPLFLHFFSLYSVDTSDVRRKSAFRAFSSFQACASLLFSPLLSLSRSSLQPPVVPDGDGCDINRTAEDSEKSFSRNPFPLMEPPFHGIPISDRVPTYSDAHPPLPRPLSPRGKKSTLHLYTPRARYLPAHPSFSREIWNFAYTSCVSRVISRYATCTQTCRRSTAGESRRYLFWRLLCEHERGGGGGGGCWCWSLRSRVEPAEAGGPMERCCLACRNVAGNAALITFCANLHFHRGEFNSILKDRKKIIVNYWRRNRSKR